MLSEKKHLIISTDHETYLGLCVILDISGDTETSKLWNGTHIVPVSFLLLSTATFSVRFVVSSVVVWDVVWSFHGNGEAATVSWVAISFFCKKKIHVVIILKLTLSQRELKREFFFFHLCRWSMWTLIWILSEPIWKWCQYKRTLRVQLFSAWIWMQEFFNGKRTEPILLMRVNYAVKVLIFDNLCSYLLSINNLIN